MEKDFEHIKEIINGTIVYIFCSRDFLEKQIKKEFKEFKQKNIIDFINLSLTDEESVNKNDCIEFLKNLALLREDIPDKFKSIFAMYYCSLRNIFFTTNAQKIDTFKNFVIKKDFYVFNKEEQCIEAVSLCDNIEELLNKDNSGDEIENFINNFKIGIIISKIRNIARKCVQEKLEEYSQDVGSALDEFEEIFVEEVRGK